MYNDSDPVTSPLITSDLPRVACSWVFRGALAGRGTFSGSAGGVNEVRGCGSGLGVWLGEGLFVGFHMMGIQNPF
jgi:hypothetical protein